MSEAPGPTVGAPPRAAAEMSEAPGPTVGAPPRAAAEMSEAPGPTVGAPPRAAANRSAAWYGPADRDGFIHRAWMRRGLPPHAFDGRPHIAICTTASDLAPCNSHLGEVAEHVKRGVWEAGGVPLEMPVPSLGETQMRPTAMLYRNLAAMAIEEMIRANPIDGVVLLGGCDKTIPSLLMGACSVDLPALVVAGG